MPPANAFGAVFFGVLLLVAVSHANNILINHQYRCNATTGEVFGVLFMLFNDFGSSATLTTNVSSAIGCTPNPAGLELSFGPTIGCSGASNCSTFASEVPAFGDPSCGSACAYMPFAVPLQPNGTNQYQPIRLCGVASWPESGLTLSPWTVTFAPQLIDIVTECELEHFDCPSPNVTVCGVEPCRCNGFEFTQLQTTDNVTTLTVNVSNVCREAFYYAAFALDGGLSLVSPAPGDSYQGAHYQWTVQLVDGAAQSTLPAVPWIRFVTNSSHIGDSLSAIGSAAWELFTFAVGGYTPAHLWTVQAHVGGMWDTFEQLSVASCLPTNDSSSLPVLNSGSSVAAVDFDPEPCPDECLQSRSAGACVDTTCAQYAAENRLPPKLDGISACIIDLSTDPPQSDPLYGNVTLARAAEPFCLCAAGYTGANCGQIPLQPPSRIHLSEAGIIALCVLGGVILFIPVAFGVKHLIECVCYPERLRAAKEFQRKRIDDESNVVPLQPIGTPPPHVLAQQQSQTALPSRSNSGGSSVVTLKPKGN